MADGTPGAFVGARGITLHTKTWLPKGQPIALLVFLHGYSTNVTSNAAWRRVADAHTSKGFLCTGFDYEGHGQSEGQFKANVTEIGSLVDDVLQFVDALLQQYPGLGVFLRGQSMGGLVALACALRRPGFFAGLALGAPAFELPWVVRKFAPQVILSGEAHVSQRVGEIQAPLAVFQGIEDTTVEPSGARRLIENAGSADKSLYLYKDMGHNMGIEPDVQNWLLARVSGGAAAFWICVRRPVPGVKWQPPPPGSLDANVNTLLDSYEDADEQKKVLDELLSAQVSTFAVVLSYASYLPLALRRLAS
mmetsp:Transcript_77989/g.216652  ORF Transcript_77989/g.216652 Transcript_77989/m.216652 type:complete len:306 (-) Transcript_77989:225-1142(-)